jgi:hypothetical protein
MTHEGFLLASNVGATEPRSHVAAKCVAQATMTHG